MHIPVMEQITEFCADGNSDRPTSPATLLARLPWPSSPPLPVLAQAQESLQPDPMPTVHSLSLFAIQCNTSKEAMPTRCK